MEVKTDYSDIHRSCTIDMREFVIVSVQTHVCVLSDSFLREHISVCSHVWQVFYSGHSLKKHAIKGVCDGQWYIWA